jgi:hypothetical protein
MNLFKQKTGKLPTGYFHPFSDCKAKVPMPAINKPKTDSNSDFNQKSWSEFRETGLLWWINMILHTFGWVIAIEINDDGTVTGACPARVVYRGFDENINFEGYRKVTNYLSTEIANLKNEVDS